MEQEIKNAVGLGVPELAIESKPKPEPELKPTVTNGTKKSCKVWGIGVIAFNARERSN
jgi:hypothetical protein